MLIFLQVFLHLFISILGEFIMKIRKSKFAALLWTVAILCVLIGVCGCDWEGLFEDMENREQRTILFDLNAFVYSEYTGTVLPGATVRFYGRKKYIDSKEEVSGSHISADRQVGSDPVKWEFDYEVLYDKEQKKYMEYVAVDIYVKYSGLSGPALDVISGYLYIYPSGGGWSSLKFSELSDSTMLNRKIMVRLPLYVHIPFDW